MQRDVAALLLNFGQPSPGDQTIRPEPIKHCRHLRILRALRFHFPYRADRQGTAAQERLASVNAAERFGDPSKAMEPQSTQNTQMDNLVDGANQLSERSLVAR